MLFHVNSIDIGIEVDVLPGIAASGMAEHMLSDILAGNFIEMSRGRMPEEMGVQMFFDAGLSHCFP